MERQRQGSGRSRIGSGKGGRVVEGALQWQCSGREEATQWQGSGKGRGKAAALQRKGSGRAARGRRQPKPDQPGCRERGAGEGRSSPDNKRPTILY